MKKKKNIGISVIKLSFLFSNITHMAFNSLSYALMIKYCSMFCKSIIKYIKLNNINSKRLKIITLKSIDLNNGKFSTILEKTIKKYQLKTKIIKITYKFDFVHNSKF